MTDQWEQPTNFIHKLSGKWQRVLIIVLAIIGVLTLTPNRVRADNVGANSTSIACVTAGPSLPSVDARQNALLNALLSNLSGANLNLPVVASNALAQGQIGQNDFLKALQTTLGVAKPDDVLTSPVTLLQVIQALAQTSNDPTVISALNTLAATPNLPTETMHLGDLLKLGSVDILA